ncbi:MAG: hypothetical protein EPN39_13035 [Chitinophagaceae bacterium]|nr:MAG: hypothetical protein EPN39_13035 [Chitinophagaceae bacterium]
MKEKQKRMLCIGWAEADITPEGPASLFGQYYERISQYVQSQLQVTACAIEAINEDGDKDQAIMISMDLLYPLKALQGALRNDIKELIPDFDTRKLFLNATHTHSAPEPRIDSDYGQLLLKQLGKVVVEAWGNRAPAGVSAELGYAVTGHNRRAKYADGTAEMYGATDRSDFIGMEGPEDSGVNMLFCWDEAQNLNGIIMNVPCPAQVTEARYYVSADYWSEVRRRLTEKFSEKVFVLAQCGAAGDLSPRDLPRGYKDRELNMWDISGMELIGKRLFQTVMEVYPKAKEKILTEVEFKHVAKDINIPTRKVSKEEYEEALKISTEIHSREPDDPNSPDTAWNRFLSEIKENEKLKVHGPWDNKNTDYGIVRKKDAVIEQYRNQESFPFYNMELHVIRIGEIVIASNSFELFVDYGFQIMGRSLAKQTFLVQLSCDYGEYLPTRIALQGGGYSAMANPVGPEGGKILVEETLNVINNLWE